MNLLSQFYLWKAGLATVFTPPPPCPRPPENLLEILKLFGGHFYGYCCDPSNEWSRG